MTASPEPESERDDLKAVLSLAIRKPVKEDRSPTDVLLPDARAADLPLPQKSTDAILFPESEKDSKPKRKKR